MLELLDIEKAPLVAIACSGGADSMALTLMAHDWAKQNNTRIMALTVDHGLRKDSAKEASQVGAWLKKLGIAHVILTWKGKKPTSNIQEEARNARYKLLTDYCKKHHITHLLVAHHLEDQAETFLLRLARGSGVDGLSAMAKESTMHGVTLIRPLLQVPKKELLAYLQKRKQAYAKDPSNDNMKYDRIKMRALLPNLAQVGLTPERLSKTATTMARARAYLKAETELFLHESCEVFDEGYAIIRHLEVSDEIALRALATLIQCIGGQETKSRLNDLERLHLGLKNFNFRGASLGGCIFAPHGKAAANKEVLITRELRAIASPLPIKRGETILWDNRFEVALKKGPATLYCGALSQLDWLFCAKKYRLESMVPDKKILYSLPALRDKDGHLYAVPHLGLSVESVDCNVTFVR